MKTTQIAIVLTVFALGCGKDEPTKNNGSNNSNNSGVDQGMTTAADMSTTPDMAQADDGTPSDTGTATDMTTTSDSGGDLGTDMTTADMGTDMGGPCSRNGLMLASQTVDWDVASNFLIYTGFTGDPSGATPYDKLSFEIYPDFGGLVAAQNYIFPGQNYADCGTCLLIFADCASGAGCAKTFLVDSGSVNVAEASTVDSAPFSATFTDLVFKEVTLDANFMSTEVVGGETYCITTLDAAGATVVTN